MIEFKDIKKLLKRDNSQLPALKVSLLGDSATNYQH